MSLPEATPAPHYFTPAHQQFRDGLRDWVAATHLPPLAPEVGVEVLARDGSLLRAYQVGSGLWRLKTL